MSTELLGAESPGCRVTKMIAYAVAADQQSLRMGSMRCGDDG